MTSEPHRFITQIIYRHHDSQIVLGWIVDCDEANHAITRYQYSTDNSVWSPQYTGYNSAISQLLNHHNLDSIHDHVHIITIPETFVDQWISL